MASPVLKLGWSRLSSCGPKNTRLETQATPGQGAPNAYESHFVDAYAGGDSGRIGGFTTKKYVRQETTPLINKPMNSMT